MKIEQHPVRSDARTVFFEHRMRASGDGRAIATYCASNEDEDRYGSCIAVSGWVTDAYERNPVVLFGHAHDSLPIGRTIKLTKTARSLDFTVEFAVQNEFARDVWELVRDGFLPGVSVAFIPLAWEPYTATTVGSTFAENRRYTKQELLELSIVPVPACRGALKQAYSHGRISDRFVRSAGLGGFLKGVSGTAAPQSRPLPPRPLGMDPELFRAATAAGLSPEAAMRAQSILRRRRG